MESILKNYIKGKDYRTILEGLTQLETLLEGDKLSQFDVTTALNDIILPVLKYNNFKICEKSLTCLNRLLVNQKNEVRHYLIKIVTLISDKIGDSKKIVRKKVVGTLIRISRLQSPTEVLNLLSSKFTSRNPLIRSEMCVLFTRMVIEFEDAIPLNQYKNSIIKLLGDSKPNVRERAMDAIEQLYRFCGDSLEATLVDRNIRKTQLNEILRRFENITPKKIKKSPRNKSRPRTAPTQRGRNLLLKKKRMRNPISFSIRSEKDYMNYVIMFIKKLKDYQNQKQWSKIWEKRLETIMDLQVMFSGRYYPTISKFDNFIAGIKKLTLPIQKQLTDLRSSVIKETCKLVSIMVVQMKDSFDFFAAYFIPNMLKLTTITVKVINSSADNCMHTIIEHCQIQKSLALIFSKFKSSKHVVLKSNCMKYLFYVLKENYNLSSKNLKRFKNIIPTSVTDALPEVRSYGRKSFWLFLEIYGNAEIKEDMERGFDLHVMKLLSKEKEKVHSVLEDIKFLKASQKELAREMKKAKKSMFETEVEGEEEIVHSPTTVIPTMSKRLLVNLGETPKLIRRMNRQTTPSKYRTNKELFDTSPESPRKTTSTMKGYMRRKVLTDPRKVHRRSLSSPKKRKRYMNSMTSSKVESVENLLKRMSTLRTTDWEKRRNVFVELQVHIQSSHELVNLRKQFGKIVFLCITKMNDPHYKVVLEVMKTLLSLIKNHHEPFERYLEKVLPKLFVKLGDFKIQVRKLANQNLEKIGENYPSGFLISVLLKIVEDPNQKIQLGCLETILHFLPVSKEWLRSATHMRHIVLKMSKMLGKNKSERGKKKYVLSEQSKKAMKALLDTVVEVDKYLFVECIRELPGNYRFILMKFYDISSIEEEIEQELFAEEKKRMEIEEKEREKKMKIMEEERKRRGVEKKKRMIAERKKKEKEEIERKIREEIERKKREEERKKREDEEEKVRIRILEEKVREQEKKKEEEKQRVLKLEKRLKEEKKRKEKEERRRLLEKKVEDERKRLEKERKERILKEKKKSIEEELKEKMRKKKEEQAEKERLRKIKNEEERIRKIKEKEEAERKKREEEELKERMKKLKEEEEKRKRREEEEKKRKLKDEEELKERMRKLREEEERMKKMREEEEKLRKIRDETDRLRKLREEEELKVRKRKLREEEDRLKEIKEEAEKLRKRREEEELLRRIKEEEDRQRRLKKEDEMRLKKLMEEEERMKKLREEEERMKKEKVKKERLERERKKKKEAEKERKKLEKMKLERELRIRKEEEMKWRIEEDKRRRMKKEMEEKLRKREEEENRKIKEEKDRKRKLMEEEDNERRRIIEEEKDRIRMELQEFKDFKLTKENFDDESEGSESESEEEEYEVNEEGEVSDDEENEKSGESFEYRPFGSNGSFIEKVIEEHQISSKEKTNDKKNEIVFSNVGFEDEKIRGNMRIQGVDEVISTDSLEDNEFSKLIRTKKKKLENKTMVLEIKGENKLRNEDFSLSREKQDNDLENNLFFSIEIVNNNLRSIEERIENIKELIQISKDNQHNDKLWKRNFGRFLFNVLQWMNSSIPSYEDGKNEHNDRLLREYSVHLMKSLILHQQEYFSEFLEISFHKILSLQNDPVNDVRKVANSATKLFLQKVSSKICFSVLKDRIQSCLIGNNNVTKGRLSFCDKDFMDCVGLMIPLLKKLKVEEKVYEKYVRMVLPCMIRGGLKHRRTDVRKKVVVCLSEMFKLLESGEILIFDKYLRERVDDVQYRLIKKYSTM